jgi:hypothetical protein
MLRANTDRWVKLETIRNAKKVARIARAEQGRQQRRDERTEEQQGEQEDERERKKLGAGEVVTDLRVGLRARDRLSAELDVGVARERTLQASGIVLDPRVRSRPEVRDDVARAPVAGGHRGVMGVVVAGDGGDVATRAHPRLDPADAALRSSAVDIPGGHERDHPGIDLSPRRRLISVRRLGRLARRVGRAIGAEPFRDPEPEHARDTDEDQGEEQHTETVPMNE